MLRSSIAKHNKLKYFLLLVAIFIAFDMPLFTKCRLNDDGGLYATLASTILHHGQYYFGDYPGDVPPLFPMLLAISMKIFGERGVYFINPLMALLSIILFYFILLNYVKPVYAFLGSLFLLFNYYFFGIMNFVLRDIPLLTFVLLGYFIYGKVREEKNGYYFFFFGLVLGLGFLIKYTALIYLSPLIIKEIKNRKILISFLTFAAVILPWSYWSYENFGTPFKEHAMYLFPYLGGGQIKLFGQTILWFIIGGFPPLVAMAFYQIKKEIVVKKWGILNNEYFLFLLFTLISVLIWPVKADRYLLPAVIPIIFFGIKGLAKLENTFVLKLLVVLIIIQSPILLTETKKDCSEYAILKDAGYWIKDNTPSESRILTQTERQISFFSQRVAIQMPQDLSLIDRDVNHYKIDYILYLGEHGKMPPESIFNKYKKVITFRQEDTEMTLFSTNSTILPE